MDKIFLVVMFSAVVFCQPTYGAMWRADEKILFEWIYVNVKTQLRMD